MYIDRVSVKNTENAKYTYNITVNMIAESVTGIYEQ